MPVLTISWCPGKATGLSISSIVNPFDWSLTSWLGVYDLAYAIVLDWPSNIRRALEMPILRHYHNTLIDRGVVDYSWDQLYDGLSLDDWNGGIHRYGILSWGD